MTDLQIEKGIECCVGEGPDCKHCPYFDDEDCCVTLNKDTRDYVKRKKEEREQIRKETAKEIIDDVVDRLKSLCNLHGAVDEFHIKYIKNSLMKNYGVEADE